MRDKGPGARGYGIYIINLHTLYKLNQNLIKKIVSEILKFLAKPRKADFEVVFLTDRAIRPINSKYRNENRPTDVLSFKIGRGEFGNEGFLAEIFISLDTARKNSKIFGTAFHDEIVLYIIHGILHLFGWDDKDEHERRRMSKKEMEILNYLCRNWDLSKVLMPR